MVREYNAFVYIYIYYAANAGRPARALYRNVFYRNPRGHERPRYNSEYCLDCVRVYIRHTFYSMTQKHKVILRGVIFLELGLSALACTVYIMSGEMHGQTTAFIRR